MQTISIKRIQFIIFLIVFLGPGSFASAQKVLIKGSSERLIEDTKLMKQYEFETLEWAINNALYNAFGSSVTSNFETLSETSLEGRSVVNHTDHRSNYVNAFPNGIWIKHNSEPRYNTYKDVKGNWWLRCNVEGYAKEMPSREVHFTLKTLDGTDYLRDESLQYISGESCYIYFRSSVEGYLTIYFDDFNTVQRCLPYNSINDNMYPIKANTDYVFFSPEYSEFKEDKTIVDEIELYTEDELEYNQFYVLFSPFKLDMPILDDEVELENNYSTFKSMERTTFQNWLQKNRVTNLDLQVEVVGITIKSSK